MLKVKNRLYISGIDCLMAHYKKFRLSTLAAVVGIVLAVGPENSYAEAPFNLIPDFLMLKMMPAWISPFFRKGYIMPGSYHLQVLVNQSQIAQDNIITYSVDNDDPDNTYPCLSPELVSLLGLKPEIADKMIWINAGQCLQPDQLEGMETQTDLSQSTLTVIIRRPIWNTAMKSGIHLPAGMKGFPACYLTTR
ncbi:fimbrial protein SteB [Salmonella enterica subsp. enterica]|uniref:Fimbrial protein SteB n=1 Tax=Salmonella enterica I TaxID=59201 RepID=A0A379WZW6_SALET|nr:fimbrial protein SteB [Salmonella enterica subsp. enterica]